MSLAEQDLLHRDRPAHLGERCNRRRGEDHWSSGSAQGVARHHAIHLAAVESSCRTPTQRDRRLAAVELVGQKPKSGARALASAPDAPVAELWALLISRETRRAVPQDERAQPSGDCL